MTKKRNPYADALRNPVYHQRVAKNAKDRVKQHDGWERGGKHRVKARDVLENLQLGDEVEYQDDEACADTRDLVGKTGIVKAHGPSGLLGVNFDGEYSLVPEEKLRLIAESLEKMRKLSR